MKKMYMPWRHDYVSKTTMAGDREKLKNECIFCHQFAQNEDEKYLILKRFKNCGVMLNYYPYNAGHIMILPYEHKPELCDLSKDIRSELMELINISIEILKKVLKPHGFNVGINLGIGSGGGLPSHLHVHVLPRWEGDTNFFATIGETKIICSDFYKVYAELKKEFDKIKQI